MEIANIINNDGLIHGLIGNLSINTNQTDISIISEVSFPNTVKEYLNSPKSEKALIMCGLDKTFLDKKEVDLSKMNLKKISFAKALITNNSIIAFNYFEKGLTSGEQKNFKMLFKKLSKDYHKTLLIFTNDFNFLSDICSDITIIDNNKIIEVLTKDNFSEIFKYLDKPPIIDFIDLLNTEYQKNIPYYLNDNDLLKEIYRIDGDKQWNI